MGGPLWDSPQVRILPLAPMQSSERRLRLPDRGLSRMPDTPT